MARCHCREGESVVRCVGPGPTSWTGTVPDDTTTPFCASREAHHVPSLLPFFFPQLRIAASRYHQFFFTWSLREQRPSPQTRAKLIVSTCQIDKQSWLPFVNPAPWNSYHGAFPCSRCWVGGLAADITHLPPALFSQIPFGTSFSARLNGGDHVITPRLSTFIEKTLALENITGLSVAVVPKYGETEFHTWGYRTEDGDEVTPDVRYPLFDQLEMQR
ncbi:hypothetical protein J3R83DRAFT_5325 [Lanmaoa asiatica]|nr:hypothetical protein J3R83DRAFT_5325 [Lanmaoa asiatica]